MKGVVLRQQKANASHQHERRANEQSLLSSPSVCGCGEPQRNDRVAEEREREKQTDLCFSKSRFGEVEREDDGEESVAEQTDDARGEEEGDVHVVWR